MHLSVKLIPVNRWKFRFVSSITFAWKMLCVSANGISLSRCDKCFYDSRKDQLTILLEAAVRSVLQNRSAAFLKRDSNIGAIHKGCPHQRRGGVSQMQTAAERGGGRLVKWKCPYFEKCYKFIFEIVHTGNCLCNWIHVTCYLTTLKSYLGKEN